MDNQRYKAFSGYVVSAGFLIMFVTIIVLGTAYGFPTYAKGQNFSQTCNSTGILIRSDGTVLLDTWKDFSGMRSPVPPPMGATSMPQNFQAVDLPLTVILGKSLNDKVKVCIETDNGSHCVLLEQVRKVK